MMAEYIAGKIMKAADISLATGQAKYRVYFINTTIYATWQADVNTILQTTTSATYPNGYGDVIVTS